MLDPCGVSFSCIAARTIDDVNAFVLASNSPAALRVTETRCSPAFAEQAEPGRLVARSRQRRHHRDVKLHPRKHLGFRHHLPHRRQHLADLHDIAAEVVAAQHTIERFAALHRVHALNLTFEILRRRELLWPLAPQHRRVGNGLRGQPLPEAGRGRRASRLRLGPREDLFRLELRGDFGDFLSIELDPVVDDRRTHRSADR